MRLRLRTAPSTHARGQDAGSLHKLLQNETREALVKKTVQIWKSMWKGPTNQTIIPNRNKSTNMIFKIDQTPDETHSGRYVKYDDANADGHDDDGENDDEHNDDNADDE